MHTRIPHAFAAPAWYPRFADVARRQGNDAQCFHRSLGRPCLRCTRKYARRQSQAMSAGSSGGQRPSIPSHGAINYAAAGVDIDREGASVAALVGALAQAPRPRQAGEFGALIDHSGGFSGLIEFGDRLLAMCTDGVGSKLMLCAELDYYESVALDCVAMNVNDLICIGAEPLAFVDYIAAPRPSPRIWAALGRSLGKACEIARVSLCGGETATLPDMVNEIDMSGTALGWLPRDQQIDGTFISDGDVIIGLPASGVHSNGYSLVREVIKISGLSLSSDAPFDVQSDRAAVRANGSVWRHSSEDSRRVCTLGEVLLNPTCIYVNPIVDLFHSVREENGPCAYTDIHGIAHITGGGLSNLLRLHPKAGYHINEPLEPLPEFKWIQSLGNITDYEMHRTFNMGMGMAIIVNAERAPAVSSWLNARMPGTRVVGTVNMTGIVSHAIGSVRFDKY